MKANSGYNRACNSSSIDIISDNGITVESIIDQLSTNATTISPLKRNREVGINNIKLNNDSVVDSNSSIIIELSSSLVNKEFELDLQKNF